VVFGDEDAAAGDALNLIGALEGEEKMLLLLLPPLLTLLVVKVPVLSSRLILQGVLVALIEGRIDEANLLVFVARLSPCAPRSLLSDTTDTACDYLSKEGNWDRL
jgi:hypothetical protein